MADLSPFPDPHDVLKLALAHFGAKKVVGPRTPPDFLDAGFPVISVRAVGGTNLADKITDVPRMAVTVYGEDYEQSRDLAEEIRQYLLSGPKFTAAGRIDRTEVEVRPIEVTYPDPKVRVHSAIYRPSFRR